MKLASEMGVVIGAPWVTWVKVGLRWGHLRRTFTLQGVHACSAWFNCPFSSWLSCTPPCILTSAATARRPPAQASIVPAAAGLLLTPLLMYKLFAPEIKDTPEAPKVPYCFAFILQSTASGALFCFSASPPHAAAPAHAAPHSPAPASPLHAPHSSTCSLYT